MDIKHAIMATLVDANRWLTINEIAERIDAPTERVKQTVWNVIRYGPIVRMLNSANETIYTASVGANGWTPPPPPEGSQPYNRDIAQAAEAARRSQRSLQKARALVGRAADTAVRVVTPECAPPAPPAAPTDETIVIGDIAINRTHGWACAQRNPGNKTVTVHTTALEYDPQLRLVRTKRLTFEGAEYAQAVALLYGEPAPDVSAVLTADRDAALALASEAERKAADAERRAVEAERKAAAMEQRMRGIFAQLQEVTP